jgi:hypothetical protein
MSKEEPTNSDFQALSQQRPLAYTVKEALQLLPFKRNKFYAEAKAGRLRLRKCGRMTIILDTDLQDYLQSLPTFQND